MSARSLTGVEVADQLNAKPDTIRKLALAHGIGENVNGRIKLYSEADVAFLRSRLGKRGRPAVNTPIEKSDEVSRYP